MGRGHPECPERLDVIDDRLLLTQVLDGLERFDAPAASIADLELAHTTRHIESIRALSEKVAQNKLAGGPDHEFIDGDTLVNEFTWSAALHAAGAAVAATDAVISGELENAFCAVRPPGHHACRDKAMGFCFFNNVAVAALHAVERHGLKRVAVVDFDVHHGNGTEDILQGDDRFLMVGFFQHPLYPNSGADSTASNMLNLPMPAYTKGLEIREAIDMMWIPRLEEFKPEMIFVSAGFDAHREDDLGQLGLVEQDFVWITTQIKNIARRFSGGKIVSCLEGGYHLDALATSVEAHVRVLADL